MNAHITARKQCLWRHIKFLYPDLEKAIIEHVKYFGKPEKVELKEDGGIKCYDT